MQSPVTIRRARPEDVDGLTGVLAILFGIEEDFTSNETRQRNGLMLLLESTNCCVLVAEADNRVIGMCTGQLTVSTAEGGPALLVEDVVVEEAWRGKGIATNLLETLAEWAADRGAYRMQLLADCNNYGALRFYDRLGWQRTQLICLRKRQ
jgi:ribosomal protein S18 acetylase RimI-like enzyme